MVAERWDDDKGEGGGLDNPQKWWRHLWTAPYPLTPHHLSIKLIKAPHFCHSSSVPRHQSESPLRDGKPQVKTSTPRENIVCIKTKAAVFHSWGRLSECLETSVHIVDLLIPRKSIFLFKFPLKLLIPYTECQLLCFECDIFLLKHLHFTILLYVERCDYHVDRW